VKTVFSAPAKAGLREIALFIARNNKARAISFVEELRTKARGISRMPYAFPLVPRYEHRGVRRRTHGNYGIFYHIEDETVVVLHILHSARDYERVLFPGD